MSIPLPTPVILPVFCTVVPFVCPMERPALLSVAVIVPEFIIVFAGPLA